MLPTDFSDQSKSSTSIFVTLLLRGVLRYARRVELESGVMWAHRFIPRVLSFMPMRRQAAASNIVWSMEITILSYSNSFRHTLRRSLIGNSSNNKFTLQMLLHSLSIINLHRLMSCFNLHCPYTVNIQYVSCHRSSRYLDYPITNLHHLVSR